ncbi:MAG: hypothetical protein MR383_12100 [Lachnospiraceae bacterium]|nr:hypothetical protein [Lachnospiraceae bacterium]MDD7026536.1 hypothetical protein [Lachnospiraceae bacterium]MDY5700104.1 DUF6612 family protein [Lachnospiraceae bacterium]
MKLLKKVSVTAGLVTMLAFAAACGKDGAASAVQQEQSSAAAEAQKEMTPQERYEAMSALQENVTSMDARVIVDMDMTLAGQNVKSVTDMRMTSFVEPFKTRMEMNIDMGDLGTESSQVYIEVTEDNKGMIYMYDGTSWTSQEEPALGVLMEQYDARSSVGAYVEGLSDLAEAGREKINGRETVKLTGAVKGEELKQSILETGSLESLQGLFDQEQISSLFDGLENENSYVELWVDAETNEMVKYTQDMTGVMNKLYENISALLPEMEGYEMEMSVGKMVVTIEDLVFDNVEDFEIPAEAKQ